MPSGSLVPAWLLKGQPFRETSQLVELFTAEQGRVSAVARGTRRAAKGAPGGLQPFTPLWVAWRGRGELRTLTHWEAQSSLPLEGERVLYGWYVNELLLRLLAREDPHPRLFEHLGITYRALLGESATAALRRFEWVLLAEVGYGLDLPPAGAPRWDWHPERGLEPADEGLIARESLQALLGEGVMGATALREARRLLQTVLHHALGGRPLETPRLLRALRARGGQGAVSADNDRPVPGAC